ncbi:MAG: D-tagatose-1,6-bisphosphate aldolase subunit KbaY [bacterium ADurb.Bin429]|nr:MAG: D-tagatose-1,6-bisphosphate aldolase subunit KbaY [bacterium ADurb.Bin429]
MPLIPMRTMLRDARAGGYAVGYFEAWDQYSLEAVLDAAERLRAPIILGVGGVMMHQPWFNTGGLRRLAALCRATAESATVPVSLILNEVYTFEQVRQGLDWGFNAVMLGTSELPFDANVRETRRVVEAAHALGADVEGEIDQLPDASGAIGDPHGDARTDPEAAARYVAETGVDALSVAIGNVHMLTAGEATIDFAHLARLRRAVDVPFVVHGGTGFPDAAVPEAIAHGVAKFNVGTVLKRLYLDGVGKAIAALAASVDIQTAVGSRKAGDVFEAGKARMCEEVMRRLHIYGCAGRG